MKNKKNLFWELIKSGSYIAWVTCLILSVRWLFFEPFVVPSGSMIPSLLIRDFIITDKFAYNVRIPFTGRLLWQRALPKRGDVVIFRSIEDNKIMTKRVIGLPGDEIYMDQSGQIFINNEKLPRTFMDRPKNAAPHYSLNERDLQASYKDFQFFLEKTNHHHFRVIYKKNGAGKGRGSVWTTDPDHVFVIGDNRDYSYDSRSWGALPVNHLLGRAFAVWMSCEEPAFSFLCRKFRWGRMFRKIR